MMTSLVPGLTGLDRRVVNDISLRQLLTDNIREGLQDGPEGWIDDMMAFRHPWGFEVSDIAAPVLLWHGAQDRFSPISHSRWLAGQIENATLKIEHGAAHFGAFEALPEVLAWLTAPNVPPSPGSRLGWTCPCEDWSERLRIDGPQQPPALPDDRDVRMFGT
jgi:pimeloyl-ACP methyl ester carboxylesterase